MNSFRTLTAVQMRCANASKSLLTQLFPHKVTETLARIFFVFMHLCSQFYCHCCGLCQRQNKCGYFEQIMPQDILIFPQAPKSSLIKGWKLTLRQQLMIRACIINNISIQKRSPRILLFFIRTKTTQGCPWNIWHNHEPQLLCRRICSHPCKKT